MTIRSLILFVSLVLSACGGNWSNRDLDFAGSLPDREMLKSKLPQAGTTSSPLTGVQTRSDPLVVGDPSTAYAGTNRAKTQFNGLIDSLLAAVDAVRAYPPSDRTANTRTWGPYPDSNNPGFEFRLVITLLDNQTFSWLLESHASAAAYFPVVSGTFAPALSLKQGHGTIVAHVSDFKNKLKTDEGVKALDRIDIAYVSDSYPHTVEMLFDFAAGNSSGLSSIGYASRELADRAGSLRFLESFPSNAQVTSLELAAAWLPSGAGRSRGLVKSGTYTGLTQIECWNESFLVTYFKQNWPGGTSSGAESDCANIAGL